MQREIEGREMEVERVLNEAETMQYSLSLELAEQTKIATLL